MSASPYVTTAFSISYKTLQRVDKLAEEYGLSRANTLMKLVEQGIVDQGEKHETSSTTKGKQNKHGVSSTVHNTLREVF